MTPSLFHPRNEHLRQKNKKSVKISNNQKTALKTRANQFKTFESQKTVNFKFLVFALTKNQSKTYDFTRKKSF